MQSLEILFILLSAGMMAIAIPLLLRRVRPNNWYGFRVPATLNNEQVWYEVNAYAGRWLLGVGVLGILAAIALAYVPGLGEDGYAWAFLVVFGVAMAVMLISSFRYLNKIKPK